MHPLLLLRRSLTAARPALRAASNQATTTASPQPGHHPRRSGMASKVPLAAVSENVAPRADANPAPAKAPRVEMFKVKRMHDDAVLPKRGSDRAAGYDLSRSGPD
jgi:hypothetical protein